MNWPHVRGSGYLGRAATIAAFLLFVVVSAHALPGDQLPIADDLFAFTSHNPFPEKPFDVLSNGENIDLYTAGLTISKADISIPGRMDRSLEIGRVYATDPQLLNQFEVIQSDNFALALAQKDERKTIVLDPYVSMGKIVYETSMNKLKNRIYWYPSATQGMQPYWGGYAGIILITYVFPYAEKEPGQPLYSDRMAYLVRKDGTLEQFDYAGNDVSPTRRSRGLLRYFARDEQVVTKPQAVCRSNDGYNTIDEMCENRQEENIGWSGNNIDGVEYIEPSGLISIFKRQQYDGYVHSSTIPIQIVYCENGVSQCLVDNADDKAITKTVPFYSVQAFRLTEEIDAFNNKREYTYSDSGDLATIADNGVVVAQGLRDYYKYDSRGRIISYANRVGEETNILYEPAEQGLPFPTPLRFASGLIPQNDEIPTSFIELHYPSGGVFRYEQYGASPVENDEQELSRRATLVTIWPDRSDADVFLQKEIAINPSWEINNGLDRLTVSYDVDGRETGYYFGKLNGIPVLKKKLLRTSSQPAFSLDSSCDDATCIQEDFAYSYGKVDVGGSMRPFVNGVSRHMLRYGGANFITTTEYDNFNPVEVSNPDGAITEYSYFEALSLAYLSPLSGEEANIPISAPSYLSQKVEHFVTAEGDKRARTTTYNWGGTDTCGKVLPPVALASSKVSDGDNAFLQSFCYDGAGNVIKASKSYSEGGDSHDVQVVDITYDESGLYPKSRKINGAEWQYVYDSSGRMIRETNANKGTISHVYDDAGRIRRVIYGSNGSFKEYKYGVVDSSGMSSVNITNFDQVRAAKTVDSLTYDGLGRLVVVDKNGIRRSLSYDARGLLHSIQEGDSSREYYYDALGRVSHILSSDTGLISFSYDVVKAGWFSDRPENAVRRSAFIEGKNVRNRYFAIDGNLLRDERMDDNGSVIAISYGYDELGNRIRKMSPKGLIATWIYDGLSRIVSSSYSTGATETVTAWGQTGMPQETISSTGQNNTYTYKGDYGRLNSVDYGGTGIPYLLSFNYDDPQPERNGMGRLTSVSDTNGNVTGYSYDPSGSLAILERSISDLNSTYSIGTMKDTEGRVYRITYSDGRAVYYLSDAEGRISGIRLNSIQGPAIAEFSYDARNRLNRIAYGNGVVASYRYVGDLLVEILVGRNNQELYHVEYAYDPRGRRIEAIFHDSSRTTYAYDDADRLTEARYYRAGDEQPHATQSYSYDADGNRLSSSDAFKSLTYVYDAHGLLTEANEANGEGWRYTYDGFGRLTERKYVRNGQSLAWQRFVWNNAGQLIRVETLDAAGAILAAHEYAYDNSGRREKRTRGGSSGYALYGEQIDPLMELNAQGEVERDFIYMEGRRIAALDAERVDFFHVDEIGSTLLTTDEDGKVTGGFRYDPFGNVNFSIGDGGNAYRFAGKHYDDETGFIYFGGRYYDPLVGRFISPDPMLEGANPYSYVGNNPFGARDVFGWSLRKAGMWGGSVSKYGGTVEVPYGDPDDGGGGGGGGGGSDGDGSPNQLGGGTGEDPGDGDNGDDGGDSVERAEPPYHTFDMTDVALAPDYSGLYDAGDLSQQPMLDIQWDAVSMAGTAGGVLPSFAIGSSEEYVIGSGPSMADAPGNNNPGVASDSWADNNPAAGTRFMDPQLVEQELANVVGGTGDSTESAGGLTQTADTANRFVQDQASSRSPNEQLVDDTDPITLHNAEVLHVERGLRIPGRGMDFEFVRTYRSRIEYDGPMGYNWDHNFNKRLVKVDHAYCDAHPLDACCTDVAWDGKPAEYIACYVRFDGNARYDAYTSDAAGQYFRAPLGYFDRLTTHGDGTVTIRDRQGLTHSYASDGLCASIEDRFGNRISLEYEGSGTDRRLARVVDTLGRGIDFSYSGKRLAEVRDFAGRKLRFGYDVHGDLITATKPATADFPDGTTTTYVYSSGYPVDKEMLNHNLLSITDPLGQTFVAFAYSFSDRVVWHRFGEGIFTIQSTMMGAWPACQTPEEVDRVASRTRLIDRNGNERLYEYNCQGNALAVHESTRGLRPGDPQEYATLSTFDLNALTTSVTRPEGNRVEIQYQQMQSGDPTVDRLFAANAVLTRRVPDAARGGDPVETAVSYEPLAMQPRVETRAGIARTQWYDYQESATVAALAAAMGISEAAAAVVFADVPLAQGDLNADGVTSTMRGSSVRIDEPLVHDQDGNEQVVRRLLRSNDHGQPVAEIDPAGTLTSFSYYVAGPQTGLLEKKVVDPAGLALTTTWTYDTAGNPIDITDAAGALTHFTYDELGRVLDVTDPTGAITRNTYDAEGNLLRVDRPGSLESGDLWVTTKTTYNMLNRPILQEDEVSADRYLVTEFRYDPGERLTRTIRPLGNSTVTEYDERDLAMRVRKGAGSAAESVEQRRYDDNGNLVELVDGTGAVTTYAYDGHDRLIETIDPTGAAVRTQYDAWDRPVALSRYGAPLPGGDPSTLLSHEGTIYDELGRVLSKRTYSVVGGVAGGYIERRSSYDAAGRKLSETDAEGNASTYGYDAAGRLTLERDAAGNEIERTFDGRGRTLTIARREIDETDASVDLFTERMSYDGAGRLVAHEDPLGHVERRAYDGRGNLVWQADARGAPGLDAGGDAGQGNVTRLAYDGLNRRTKIVQELRDNGAGNGTLTGTIQTTSTWDDNGNLIALADAKGNTTTSAFDAQDRRVRLELPDGAAYSTTWDKASRPLRETDPRGIVVRRSYDEAGRLVQRTASQGAVQLRTDQFGYDGLGRLREAEGRDGSGALISRIEEDFDGLGRNAESRQDGISVSRFFDLVGRVTGVAGENGIAALYQRDAIGRIISVSEASLGLLAIPQYAGPVREAGVAFGNGLTLTKTYDAAARPVAWRVEDAAHQLQTGFETGYDRAGQKLLEKRLHDSGTGELYQYDSLNRLVAATQGVADPELHAGGPIPASYAQHIAYAIDPVHNWTSRTAYRDPANPALNDARVYGANTLNQYASLDRSIDGGAPMATSFIYDEAGNLLDDGKYRYTYDDRNLVTEVRDALSDDLVASYAYDALKRRISEVRSDGTVTTFVYDGWQEVQQITDGMLSASYVYADGIDRPIATVKDNHAYYYHADSRNNIAAITDENGAVIERYVYDPYGKAAITDAAGNVLADSAIGNMCRFSSRRYDDATGLYYYRHRMYSSELGRFLQRDPKEYAESMNLFAYVVDDPINRDDPYGLRADYETLQPEGWKPNSAEVWGMSAQGVDTPAWYAYAEGAMVTGPAVALAGVAATSLTVTYGPMVAIATAEYVVGLGSEAITFVNTVASDIAAQGILGYSLTHPENAGDIIEGAISGFMARYAEETTGLPPKSMFYVLGEYTVGQPAGLVARNIYEPFAIGQGQQAGPSPYSNMSFEYRNAESSSAANADQTHPKKR